MPVITVTNVLVNGLYAWNLVMGVTGLVYALTQPGSSPTSSLSLCEQQLQSHLYRSSIINIVATVILLAAFNATHCYYTDDDSPPLSWKSLLAYRAPFITMGVFYTCRVLQSLYYSVPIISLCVYEQQQEQRSFGTVILFIQCVTYVLMTMGGIAYALSLTIPCTIK